MIKMIKIVEIDWFGFEEADVYLSDNTFQVKCFAHPFPFGKR